MRHDGMMAWMSADTLLDFAPGAFPPVMALFASGDAVLARDNGNFYAARVIKVEKIRGQGREKRVGALRGQTQEWMYKCHFKGWSARYDRWVTKQELKPASDAGDEEPEAEQEPEDPEEEEEESSEESSEESEESEEESEEEGDSESSGEEESSSEEEETESETEPEESPEPAQRSRSSRNNKRDRGAGGGGRRSSSRLSNPPPVAANKKRKGGAAAAAPGTATAAKRAKPASRKPAAAAVKAKPKAPKPKVAAAPKRPASVRTAPACACVGGAPAPGHRHPWVRAIACAARPSYWPRMAPQCVSLNLGACVRAFGRRRRPPGIARVCRASPLSPRERRPTGGVSSSTQHLRWWPSACSCGSTGAR
jgi:hypothetical protein